MLKNLLDLEGHGGPGGFVSKCVMFKGKAYCLLTH